MCDVYVCVHMINSSESAQNRFLCMCMSFVLFEHCLYLVRLCLFLLVGVSFGGGDHEVGYVKRWKEDRKCLKREKNINKLCCMN